MAATMTDLQLLTRAVLLHPADDFPRLQYADACDEAGDHARAEVVRGGIFTERRGAPDGPCGPGCPCGGVGNRVAELIDQFGDEWNPLLPGERRGELEFAWRRGFPDAVRCTLAAFMRHAAALFAAHPITAVTLTDREPGHEPTDQQPWRWYAPEDSDADDPRVFAAPPHRLPARLLWEKWRYFGSREEAVAFLSRACVAYGRGKAGLPPLGKVRSRYLN